MRVREQGLIFFRSINSTDGFRLAEKARNGRLVVRRDADDVLVVGCCSPVEHVTEPVIRAESFDQSCCQNLVEALEINGIHQCQCQRTRLKENVVVNACIIDEFV